MRVGCAGSAVPVTRVGEGGFGGFGKGDHGQEGCWYETDWERGVGARFVCDKDFFGWRCICGRVPVISEVGTLDRHLGAGEVLSGEDLPRLGQPRRAGTPSIDYYDSTYTSLCGNSVESFVTKEEFQKNFLYISSAFDRITPVFIQR